MYRLLIAEDEEIERRSLVQIISNSPLEIDEICSARNGQEAVEFFIRYKPDIILIDINMPIMNGLDAIKKIKEIAEVCPAFIILTSYDYFSYAQQALRLGVEDFLLKPANRDTIISAISKSLDAQRKEQNKYSQTNALLNKMQNLMPLLRDDCIQAILSNQDEVTIKKAFDNIHYIVKCGFCIIIELGKNHNLADMVEEFADIGYSCIYAYRNQQLILFILSSNTISVDDSNYIRTILERNHLFQYAMGLGSVQLNAGKLYVSYLQATSHMIIMMPDEFQLTYDDDWKEVSKNSDDIEQLAERVLQAFDQQNDAEVREMIHNISIQYMPKRSEEINDFVTKFLQILQDKLQNHYHIYVNYKDVRIVTIQEQNKYQNLEIAMIYMMNSLLEPFKEQRTQNTSHIVKAALSFIRGNFRNPISLNNLSAHLKVSPFYISKLLNKECGKPFTDIVNEYRIKEAKNLIKQGHLIKEVASEVGFQSSSYFTKTFKKYVGMAATEYRDMFMK